MPTLNVTLPTARYAIEIQSGALAKLGEMLAPMLPQHRALLVVDSTIAATHGKMAEQSLYAAGYDVATVHAVAKETQKTLQAVQRIYNVMLGQRLERTSPVIALGGGLVGDVAGFAAATFLRGVPLVQVPTTLLAMVDAAIGGKTAVNAPLPDGGLGKNLIGAFWQPRFVLSDPQVLQTLDIRHLRCGLAESIKHALIGDAELLAVIAAESPQLLAHDMDALTHLIARSAAVKVSIIQQDERETGQRALLNLGHTFAHAIEPISELDLQHGEAVAVGLCAATHCATLLGKCDVAYAKHITEVIHATGLPARVRQPVGYEPLLHAMMYDKKILDGKLRLVLPNGDGSCELVHDVPIDIVRQAWTHVGAA